MQEKMVYAGQYDNYGSCDQLISVLTRQEISSAQVFRITNADGIEFDIDEQAARSLSPVQQREVVYSEIDGSMIQTKEGWFNTFCTPLWPSATPLASGAFV